MIYNDLFFAIFIGVIIARLLLIISLTDRYVLNSLPSIYCNHVLVELVIFVTILLLKMSKGVTLLESWFDFPFVIDFALIAGCLHDA